MDDLCFFFIKDRAIAESRLSDFVMNGDLIEILAPLGRRIFCGERVFLRRIDAETAAERMAAMLPKRYVEVRFGGRIRGFRLILV
jgi:hypothetical protein